MAERPADGEEGDDAAMSEDEVDGQPTAEKKEAPVGSGSRHLQEDGPRRLQLGERVQGSRETCAELGVGVYSALQCLDGRTVNLGWVITRPKLVEQSVEHRLGLRGRHRIVEIRAIRCHFRTLQ